jgi:hypothetical protein
MVQTQVPEQNWSYCRCHRADDMTGGSGTVSDIHTFQDALRKFPPRTDKEGNTIELKDVICHDCEAVFSSTYDSSCLVESAF